VIPTIVPSSTACSPGGHSWLNFFNYLDGSGESIKSDSPIVGINVIYINGEPIIETVTSATPTPEIPDIGKLPFLKGSPKYKGFRLLRRELIQ
jgi:type IV pilus assembly protein PilY1